MFMSERFTFGFVISALFGLPALIMAIGLHVG